jgi:hypothetical protein
MIQVGIFKLNQQTLEKLCNDDRRLPLIINENKDKQKQLSEKGLSND